MNAQVLKNYYVWAIKGLVFVIPFLSLWIAMPMYFPYITGRNFAFRILIEIALVLWIGLAILDKKYRPKPTLLLWAVTVFVAVVGLADLLGVDPYTSFWSRFERMEGYLMILHLYAYFLVITNIFRTKKEWLLLFNLFIIAGVLVSGYGLLQVLGLKEAIQGGGVRVDGTIGNPTYLAAYLMLITALAMILFFNASKKWQKYLYLGVLIFNFIILYFTASRGVVLALLMTAPLFLAFYWWKIPGATGRDRLFKRLALGGLLAMILVPLFFVTIRNTNFVRENDVLSRFANISFSDDTVRARFLIWKMSWQGVLERPILGWGQENYLQVFSKHFHPRLYDQEPWFDRAHNIVLDWLINAGIIGLVSYLALFVAYFLILYRSWRTGKISVKESLVLFLTPVAYFIQNLLVFDNFNTYALFFALLGYISFYDQPDTVTILNKSAPRLPVNRSLSITAALLAIILTASYFINLKPAKAAIGIIDSLKATTDRTDPINKTLETFKRTLDYKTFGETEALEQLARVAQSLAVQEVPPALKKNFINFSVDRLEDYLKRFPANIRVHLFLGALYNSSISLDPQYILKAREHFQLALGLSPTKQQIYYVLAENYLRTNELNKSLELLQAAIDLEPTNSEALANKAVVAVLSGRTDVVNDAIRRLAELRLSADSKLDDRPLSKFIYAMTKIASAYKLVGNVKNARIIYEQLLKLNPDSQVFKDALEDL